VAGVAQVQTYTLLKTTPHTRESSSEPASETASKRDVARRSPRERFTGPGEAANTRPPQESNRATVPPPSSPIEHAQAGRRERARCPVAAPLFTPFSLYASSCSSSMCSLERALTQPSSLASRSVVELGANISRCDSPRQW